MTHSQIELAHLRQDYETELSCARVLQDKIDMLRARYDGRAMPEWLAAQIKADQFRVDGYLSRARLVQFRIERLTKGLTPTQ